MVIELIEPETLRSLLNCIETIEQNLQTKEKFLASLYLQDKVLGSLQELSEISRSFAWGYRGTIYENATRQNYRKNADIRQGILATI